MGRFNGLTDAQWQVIEHFLSGEPKKRGRGYPHAPWRSICNTILWMLITCQRRSKIDPLFPFPTFEAMSCALGRLHTRLVHFSLDGVFYNSLHERG